MQSISVVTLGVDHLARSRRFYFEGFGWTPVFENDEIVFWQMNGLVFGTGLRSAMEADMARKTSGPGAFALAHNVPAREDVQPLMDRLLVAGGSLLTPAKAPPFPGYHGHVADPDGHAWEIAWNPAFPLAADGSVTFGL